MSATPRGNNEQIELSSSLCEDVVDSSLFHGGAVKGNNEMYSERHCCKYHRNTEWEWVPKGNTPLYKFVFGQDQGYISDSTFKHGIPNPVHVGMMSFEKRKETFVNTWPKQIYQIPRDLARAGFFYTGRGDKCTTFCCGRSVYQWDHRDDAVREHMKYSPTCLIPKLLEN